MNYKLKYLKYKLKYKKLKGGMLKFDSEQEVIISIEYMINYLYNELSKDFTFQPDDYEPSDPYYGAVLEKIECMTCTIEKKSFYYELYTNIINYLYKILSKIDKKNKDENKKLKHFNIIDNLEHFVSELKNIKHIQLTNNITININNNSRNDIINFFNKIINYFKKDYFNSISSKLESLSSE